MFLKLKSGVGWKMIFTLLVPLALLPLPLLWQTPVSRCLYVFCIMGCFWLFELLPIPATSLIPVVLFPVLDIMPTSQEKMKMTFSYNILLKTQHKGERPLNCEYVAILVVNNNQ